MPRSAPTPFPAAAIPTRRCRHFPPDIAAAEIRWREIDLPIAAHDLPPIKIDDEFAIRVMPLGAGLADFLRPIEHCPMRALNSIRLKGLVT